MKTIIKRNGEAVPFDESKIFNAIYAANKAVKDEPMTNIDFEYLTKKVLQQLDGDQCTVEQVQDIVESMLIKYDYEKTAKAYILYRAEHAKIRDAESDLMNIYNELTYSDSKDADIKRENANIDGDTSMGTMLKYGSEGAKYYVDNYVLPKEIAKAHINGDIHIHCGCCEDCGDFYEIGFDEAYEMPDEDEGEITELPSEEAEAVLKAVAELILPLLQE